VMVRTPMIATLLMRLVDMMREVGVFPLGEIAVIVDALDRSVRTDASAFILCYSVYIMVVYRGFDMLR
jgi:hypothetical protein